LGRRLSDMEASPGHWDLEQFDDFAVWATSFSFLPKTKPVRRALSLLNELSDTVLRISGPPLDDHVGTPPSSTPVPIPSPSIGPLVPLPVVVPEPPRPRPRTRGGGSNVDSSGPPAESVTSTSPTNSSKIKSKPRGKPGNPPPPEYTQEMKPPVRKLKPSYFAAANLILVRKVPAVEAAMCNT
jgi:hypothetical protein